MSGASATDVLDPAIAELLSASDGLLVLAKGLGMPTVLRRVVEACLDGPLAFLLNTDAGEARELQHAIALRGGAPPVAVTAECGAAERAALYRGGGVLIVTARILVVDLLCDRVPVEHAAGVVVANAHRVTENSNVAFILRLFRQRNRDGFVKALTEDAPAVTKGFAKVEQLMRSLYVRRLLLWPRFHQSVSGALEAAEPRVEQLLVGLSARGQALQKALLQAVDACLQELRGCTSDVDVSQLTVENALFKSFDTVVRLQLEPVWHRIPRRAKALCSDLHHLRKLLNSLVRYDAVTFFEYLESVFDATSAQPPAERSHWVLQHSEPVYVLARDRVYELVREQRTLAEALAPGAAAAAAEAAAAAAEAAEADDEARKRQRVDGDTSADDAPPAEAAPPAEPTSLGTGQPAGDAQVIP